jgi:hypothetical protein
MMDHSIPQTFRASINPTAKGEVRADWRATWAVLYSPKDAKYLAAIDVLSNWDRTLNEEKMNEIKRAILHMEDEEVKELANELVEIKCQPGDRPKSPTLSALEREKLEKKSQHTCGCCVII